MRGTMVLVRLARLIACSGAALAQFGLTPPHGDSGGGFSIGAGGGPIGFDWDGLTR